MRLLRWIDRLRKPPLRKARSLRGMLAALMLLPALAACSGEAADWHGVDLEGVMPDLAFTMTRASDGKLVTADDFDNTVRLVYFGYTFCPDVCPLTLANIAQVLQKLGDEADAVRVLFVTVDPKRDSLEVLSEYADAFAPQVVGLRGTADQIAALAKRYRAAYSVKPDPDTGEPVVTHSSAIYVFDREGKARLLLTGYNQNTADIDGAAADLKRLIEGTADEGGWFAWF